MQNLLLNVLIWIIKTLSNIFVRPIMALLIAFIPSIGDYIIQTQNFFSSYIFEPMKWGIRFLLNVTGLPQTILTFAFTYLTLKVALHLGMQVVKLTMRIWRLVKP